MTCCPLCGVFVGDQHKHQEYHNTLAAMLTCINSQATAIKSIGVALKELTDIATEMMVEFDDMVSK